MSYFVFPKKQFKINHHLICFSYHQQRQRSRDAELEPVAPQVDAEQASQDLAALLNAGLSDD